ncbi:MAG TPA: tryptophan synthase subunit alpha [Phycisphaerales bacterium]|nr:tryptophan synthase subunit alpha [Phycisphaerales bacterium]HRQ75522.1 tryptophan synthase subunit alpha [Phycisphaerales bacterium]
MSRIDGIFNALRKEGRSGLMPFITGGYPSLDITANILPALELAGASIVEIGIPFSDPIADGPVIAVSMHEALEAGVTPDAIFKTVAAVRASTRLGLIAMVSHSIVHRIGTQAFIERAAESGLDGFIIPDLDTSSGEAVSKLIRDQDMSLSLLIAPTTTPARMKTLISLSSGFIYLLARTGLTGERDDAPSIAPQVEAIRKLTDLPIAVGFGVSRAEHVAAVTEQADAAIVGSALVRRMSGAADPVAAAAAFVSDLARGLRGANVIPR